jgi:hypothetical protein
MHRLLLSFLPIGAALVASGALAASYPPPVELEDRPVVEPNGGGERALIFTNTHVYPDHLGNPGGVTVVVEVHDNCGGNPAFYEWKYTVTNHTYDPNPGTSNGFSGFETALPAAVPDIHGIQPNVPQNWMINCCSGLPVEWDKNNTGGLGVMPGQTQVFRYCTLPRLIVPSTGWFHTWEFDSQSWIINYPPGDEVEVPDVIANPVSVDEGTWGEVKSKYR